MGNSLQLLADAKQHISINIGRVEEVSSVYKTAPWGNTNQADFYNQVLKVITHLSPLHLLHAMMDIEQQMGRSRHQKWAPRTIDIDVLFVDDIVMNTPDLTLPHPLLHQRRFTLTPLAQIAGGFIHPVFKQSIFQLLQLCEDNSIVEKL